MNDQIEPISIIELDDEISQEEIFEKIKEIIENDKTEYPSSSLFSMVIDSVSIKRSIFKINADFDKETFQEDFVVLE